MTDPTPQPATDQQRLPALCPYCGHGHSLAPGKPRPLQCESCKGRFEPLSRQATQNAMGPWQIRDPENPFRPPCSYETVVRLAQRGRITLATIVRGPTTRQFWTYARDAPGVAAVLGQCHACHTPISADDTACPSCEATLRPQTDRQQLGLSPKAVLPGEAPPEQIAALIRPKTPQPLPRPSQPAPEAPAAPQRPANPAPPTETAPPAPATPETIPDRPAPGPSRRRTKAPGWLITLLAIQAAAILALGALLLIELDLFAPSSPQSQASSTSSDPNNPVPDSPPLITPVPEDETTPAPSDPDDEPAPGTDINDLMDDAMRPFADRYWAIVEGTRSEDTDTLARAIDQLRDLRSEAAAASTDADFTLTDDLIAQAQSRLDQLRLLEQFDPQN